MNITIIGANSFIARNFIFYIKSNANTKDVILNLYDYQGNHIDGQIGYHQVNLMDDEDLKKINLNVDIIYMFVGKTGTIDGFNSPELYVNVNEITLLKILKLYVDTKSIATIVFPSSRLVYKGFEGLLKETDEKELKTVYAINKYACEHYLKAYHLLYGVKYVVFRICVPYGSMIPNATSYGTIDFMISKARDKNNIVIYGNGEQRRTITHMEDLCHALLKGALNKECINDIYNIGGEGYSIKDIAEGIAKRYSVGIDYIEWPKEALAIESGSTEFDSHKFDNINSFQYTRSFQEWVNGKTNG